MQSKVSKIETAKQLPTAEDIRQWVGAVAVPTGTETDLLSLLEQARAEYATFRQQYRDAGGAAALQADILALEREATRLGKFQPALIPGLLQTAEYARELLHLPCVPVVIDADEDEITRLVAVRMERQQVLYDPGKRVQIVLLEAALRTRLCSAPTLLGQLDRLLAVIGLPTLELGIIPFDVRVPVFPLSGFSVYDQDLVVIETVIGETQLSDPVEVEQYSRLFELLREAASYGTEAAAIIRRAVEELSSNNS